MAGPKQFLLNKAKMKSITVHAVSNLWKGSYKNVTAGHNNLLYITQLSYRVKWDHSYDATTYSWLTLHYSALVPHAPRDE